MLPSSRTPRSNWHLALVVPLALAATVVQSQTPAPRPAHPTSATPPRSSIVVNGQELSVETVRQLQLLYPVTIPPGRYWYDPISGVYGLEGQPVAGQMLPGLSLGGPLAAQASHGTSGVYINGRQLTTGEKLYIEQLCQTPVPAGRFWVVATGLGGYEGQPTSFNLAQCPGVTRSQGGGQSMSRTFCDANGACTSTGILGSITTAHD